MKVLLLGNGIHKDFYYHSLCFIDGIEDICINKPITPVMTDIVVTEPFILDENLIKEIRDSNFTGTLMIEKMVTKDISWLDKLLLQLANCSIFVCHRRLYSEPLPVRLDASNYIYWPNLYTSCMDPLWNTLPNIIDSLYIAFHNTIPQLISATKQNENIICCFNINGNETVVCVYPGNSGDLIAVNDVLCPWPNAHYNIHDAWNEAHKKGLNQTIKYTKLVHQLILNAEQFLKKIELSTCTCSKK